MKTLMIDEGHIFTEEDTVFNIKWKVNDLKNQGYSDEDILEFDYCDEWHNYDNIFIAEIKKQKHETNYTY